MFFYFFKYTHALVAQLEIQSAKMVTVAKMSALGEMAGGMAHEINTPLSAIQLLASQLRRAVLAGNPDKDLVSRKTESIEKMVITIAKIVHGLRLFARDGHADAMESVKVLKLIDDVMALSAARFRHHVIDVRIASIAEDAVMTCRGVQIGQVLLNLLNNSFDAIEDQTEKWVCIDFCQSESDVKLSVTDSGHGIPASIQDKLMEPFFTTKEVGRGTGLGLSISRGIMESQGGTLTLDTSHPNTRFVISLPVDSAEALAA